MFLYSFFKFIHFGIRTSSPNAVTNKYQKMELNLMGKLGVLKEVFEFFIIKRKFHMFPIIVLLIAMIGLTALAQSGLVAFIYPI